MPLWVGLIAAAAVLVVLALPLLLSDPGPLTSDQSLYVSEALNLSQDKGYTYTTGEAVNHRGPVFPALLAVDFSIFGVSVDHALWVTRLIALGAAAAAIALGWRAFGRETGLLAGALVLASALLTVMGTSLFLDGTQTLLLLVTLLLLHRAFREDWPLMGGLAGLTLGLAVLTKESALLWLPLPFLMSLLVGPALRRAAGILAAYVIGFLGVAGWWWLYVLAVTGHVYLLGPLPQALLWLAGIVLGGIAIVRLSRALLRRADGRATVERRWLAVGALTLAWGMLFLVGLELNATWPFPRDYWSNVPDYVWTVMTSWVRPLPLIVPAWGYVAYRAARGSLSDRLLALAAALFLPFALFVANRDLHVRDVLPLVYLSYLALARAAVDLARWLAEGVGERRPVGYAAAGLVVAGAFSWFAVAEAERFADQRDEFVPSVVQEQHWDNPLVHEAAAWIEEHVPPGARIMSGRLYYSHLYTLTDGRYPWWQLPTVRVDVEGDALERASTLFRWEDHTMPDGPGEPWLYLRRYEPKGYYVALSERDLIDELADEDIAYVVLTGNDAGFSSLSLRSYFDDHPYFAKAQSFIVDGANQIHIYRVLPSFSEPIALPALVNGETVAALRDDLGDERADRLLAGLSPGGYSTSGY